MPSNRMIKFRVTENQYERILNNTSAYGHATISSYLRSLALERNLVIENKILETNKIIKEILENIKIGK